MNKNELMGKQVRFSQIYHKDRIGNKRKYEAMDTQSLSNMPFWHGWIIGFRTIQSGYMTSETDDIGVSTGDFFVPTKYIRCVLICTSPHETPYRVPLDKFEVIE